VAGFSFEKEDPNVLDKYLNSLFVHVMLLRSTDKEKGADGWLHYSWRVDYFVNKNNLGTGAIFV
jgi:hypothetical protein